MLEPPAMASAVIVTGERHALPLDAYSGSAPVAAVVTASMLARPSVSARATGRRSRFAMRGVRGLGDRACCRSRVGILDRLGPEAEAEPCALSLAGARLAQDR